MLDPLTGTAGVVLPFLLVFTGWILASAVGLLVDAASSLLRFRGPLRSQR